MGKWRNICRCKLCGDVIESKFVHDYQECSCGACFTDGGTEYCRRGWNTEYGLDDVIENIKCRVGEKYPGEEDEKPNTESEFKELANAYVADLARSMKIEKAFDDAGIYVDGIEITELMQLAERKIAEKAPSEDDWLEILSIFAEYGKVEESWNDEAIELRSMDEIYDYYVKHKIPSVYLKPFSTKIY